MGQGRELRRAREAAGLSVDDVASRTRIPVRYLEAIENDDHAAFPAGPFRTGFTKKYRALLNLGDAVEDAPMVTETAPSAPSSRTRRQALTAVGVGATIVLFGFALAQVWPSEAPAPAVGEPFDLTLTVDVEEAVRARVYSDGDRIYADAVKPGLATPFQARDRLVVELDTLTGVELTFQGKQLRTLGLTSRPRRLVFIDDAQ